MPRVFLLNDVPRLGDVAGVTEDFTYAVDETPARQDGALETLMTVYAKSGIDEPGEAIDLRNQPEEMVEVGETETPEQARKRERPRYDPETGELIQPIPFADHPRDHQPRPADIPFATAVVTYATVGTTPARNLARVLLDLVQPMNIVVMFSIFVIHLMLGISTAVMILGIFLIAPGFISFIMAIFAHYGNVIDDVATEERDELPRGAARFAVV